MNKLPAALFIALTLTLTCSVDAFLVSSRRTVFNDNVTRTLQTTDGTQTHMTSYTTYDNAVTHVRVRVTARQSSNTDSKGWDLFAVVKRNSGGDASIVGAVINAVTAQGDLGAALWDATLTVSGTGVRVSCTGAMSATIDWSAIMAVLSHQP